MAGDAGVLKCPIPPVSGTSTCNKSAKSDNDSMTRAGNQFARGGLPMKLRYGCTISN